MYKKLCLEGNGHGLETPWKASQHRAMKRSITDLLAFKWCGWWGKYRQQTERMVHINQWNTVRFGDPAKPLSPPALRVNAEVLCAL